MDRLIAWWPLLLNVDAAQLEFDEALIYSFKA
jgi:hypothetical protein